MLFYRGCDDTQFISCEGTKSKLWLLFFIVNKKHGSIKSLEIYFNWTPVEVTQIQAF